MTAPVAVCEDVPSPADGSAFSSCTTVAWLDSSEIGTGFFDGFTMQNALDISAAVLVLWALAWLFKQFVRVSRQR
jgi:hypothetical protein